MQLPETLNFHQARLIKKWRVDLKCTWGKVSQLAYKNFGFNVVLEQELPGAGKILSGSQICGRDLCRMAQDVLSEKWDDECAA